MQLRLEYDQMDLKAASAELNRVIESGDWERWQLDTLLTLLADEDSPESLARVLEVMENEEVEFSRRSTFFLGCLRDVEDPELRRSVYESARRILEKNFEGDYSWVNTRGYVELIARHGGTAGADFLEQIIRNPDRENLPAWTQVAHIAVGSISSVAASQKGDDFLSLLKSGPLGCADERSDQILRCGIAQSLMQWPEREWGDRALEFVRTADWHIDVRSMAFSEYGKTMYDPHVLEYLAKVRQPPEDPADATLHMNTISAIAGNDSISTEVRAQLLPHVVGALAFEDFRVWQPALYAVDHEEFHNPEVRALLERAARDTKSKQLRSRIQQLLRSVRAWRVQGS